MGSIIKLTLIISLFFIYISITQATSAADGWHESPNVLSTENEWREISNQWNEIDVLQFGAKGDGVTNDTVALQRAFNKCSELGLTCKIPKNKTFLVTEELFLWGKASLMGEDETGVIDFRVKDQFYLLNIGISGKNEIEEPFSGVISGVKFKVSGGKKGRIIFFWRTQGARILDNIFEVGNYRYSATSSGNVNSWLKDINHYVRKNITISRNKIIAKADYLGSEGIGLGSFDGVVISENTVTGVGDDPIAVHYCRNVNIINNFMTSVDGRLFASNSINVEIRENVVRRVPSPLNNKSYKGIALIYIGFEQLNRRNSYSAPTNINVFDNDLYYPPGAIDTGAGIYVYGPRNVHVGRNKIINDSEDVIATAIHLLPAPFSAKWNDPDSIDKSNIARVWDVSIYENFASGKFPQKIIMTGKCVDYMGEIIIRDNLAKGYQLYCPKVKLTGNKKHVTKFSNQ